MSIYFIKNPLTNAVKIGWSQTIPTKMQQLSDAAGIDLVLLGIVDGDKEELEKIRAEFDESNYMSDWYNLTPKLSEFLRDVQEQPRRPQMVRVRWDVYQLLVERKRKTHIPIVKLVELAILAYFEVKLTTHQYYGGYGGSTDDEQKY